MIHPTNERAMNVGTICVYNLGSERIIVHTYNARYMICLCAERFDFISQMLNEIVAV